MESVGTFNERIKVDEAGFADLIRQSEANGWLSSVEVSILNKVRRDYRNPYVHPHDFGTDNDFSKPNFLRQLTKITAPQLVEGGSEDEARESIRTLVKIISEYFTPLLWDGMTIL